jgi:hypothetical protein
VILLPKTPAAQISQAASAFAEDFEAIFEPEKETKISKTRQSQTHEDDDWAELTSNADTQSLDIRTRSSEQPRPTQERLPSLATLPRPEILFQQTTPYLLHITKGGAGNVTVSGTHEPSLRLLAEYLQKWIKTDPQDVRKVKIFFSWASLTPSLIKVQDSLRAYQTARVEVRPRLVLRLSHDRTLRPPSAQHVDQHLTDPRLRTGRARLPTCARRFEWQLLGISKNNTFHLDFGSWIMICYTVQYLVTTSISSNYQLRLYKFNLATSQSTNFDHLQSSRNSLTSLENWT